MKTTRIAALLLVLFASLPILAQRSKVAQPRSRTDVVEFEVPLGGASNGFTYTRRGSLFYNGRNFSPSVTANIDDVQKFKISFLPSSGLAGVISVDGDGQNRLFLLNLNDFSSIPMQLPGHWNAAQKVFWSPSRKYMVALCAYEGERFVSMDLNTMRMVEGEFLGRGDRIWGIKGEPRWLSSSDVLVFNVGEYCNPYDNPNCSDRV